MITVYMPSGKWKCYPTLQKSSIYYCTGFMLMTGGSLETYQVPCSYLDQGYEAIHGNNSVFHEKVTGSVCSVGNLCRRSTSFPIDFPPFGRYEYTLEGQRVSSGPPLFPGQSFSVSNVRIHTCEGKLAGGVTYTSVYTLSLEAFFDGVNFSESGDVTHKVTYSDARKSSVSTSTISSSARIEGDKIKRFTQYGPDSVRTLYNTRVLSASKPSVASFDPVQICRPFYNQFSFDYGILSARCAHNLQQCDINMISYCKEIPGLPGMVRSTAKALTSLKNPKSWADLFLSAKYGWGMTIKDTNELLEGLYDRAKPAHAKCDKVYSRTTTSSSSYPATVSYEIIFSTQETPGSALRKCIDSGFWPTATNMWDLVPFSFVVNWMTGMGRIVDSLDRGIYLSLLPCLAAINSARMSGIVPPSMVPGSWTSAMLTWTHYERNVSESIILPRLELGKPTGASHAVELTALVGQKIL